MRDVSHKTWIAIVLDHVNAWRKANGWSRETVVQMIVEAHECTNGPVVTGIKFEPHTADTFERWKVNADRVFRWLDDSSKDTNLLPTNFIPSILAAMLRPEQSVLRIPISRRNMRAAHILCEVHK